jgi:hypothetical protein
MTVTAMRDNVQVANSDTVHYYEGLAVSPATVFVFTFRNGAQVAVTGYRDREGDDVLIGVPTPSGPYDIVNFGMWRTNAFGSGSAGFDVYAYAGGTLGSLLYSFSDTAHIDATFRFAYNVVTGNLTIDLDHAASDPNSVDGTLSSFDGITVLSSPICYLRGTRILTAAGEVPVESLQQGGLVATRFGGLRPVRWIGTQNFIGLNSAGMLAPICIRARALGPDQPLRDLWVSPGHAVLVEGHLVCAYLLLNGTTIVQPPHTGEIAYFHIDLGTHDCVLAEGAWSETYYEHLNRDEFDNADTYRALFPGHAPSIQPTCLPYVNQPDHPALPALQAALLAAPAPIQPSADPHGVHLLADGQPILPHQSHDGTWRFHLPAGIRNLRLRSHTAIPYVAFGLPDLRRLGLRLHAATLAHNGGETALDLASPALTAGWHALEMEADGPWRWTDGDAELPTALFAPTDATLILHGYAMPAPQRRALAA